jgi:hypothetical protein
MSTITDTYGAVTTMTITLASLASSVAGVGRQSTIVDNTSTKFLSALVNVKVTVGTTPTANTPIYVYLIRSNADGTPIQDDGSGASDAALTVVNSPLLGVINCPAATSDTAYYGIFDTSALGPLGPKWGIAVVQSTVTNFNSTAGNHIVNFIGVTKTVA